MRHMLVFVGMLAMLIIGEPALGKSHHQIPSPYLTSPLPESCLGLRLGEHCLHRGIGMTRKDFPNWYKILDDLKFIWEAGELFLPRTVYEPEASLIERVQIEINAIPYIQDTDNWNELDYWATPREFFERGGDCEDYAATKLVYLVASGVGCGRLYLVVIKESPVRPAHAVTVVAGENDELQFVLDNRFPLPITEWPREYEPKYAVSCATFYSIDPQTTASSP